METKQSRGNIQPLTSFRFVADILVFVTHVGLFQKQLNGYQLGAIGVSFFFVLSGFILTYNYFPKFQRINASAVKSFYIARIAKIYPVHILTFFLVLPLQFPSVIPAKKFVVEAIINLALFHSYFHKLQFSFNGVSWSLSDEVTFYLLLPFLLILLNKIRTYFTGIKPFMVAFVLWLAMFAAVFRVPASGTDWLLYSFPPMRLVDFISGMLMGFSFMNPRTQSTASVSKFTILEIVSIITLVVGILITRLLPLSERYSLCFIPFWCFLIYTFAFQRGLLSRFMSKRVFVYLGEISFSFYMVHSMTIIYLSRVLHFPYPLMTVIDFVASVAFSSILYSLYEEPIRKKIRGWYHRVSTKHNEVKRSAIEPTSVL